ncbi:hypothetical protein [Streptomyces virginiae]|uniref:hypothetical protein n=1 Tax=Streptomyces virginiae TaxID=1961 RepID=UPI00368B16A6
MAGQVEWTEQERLERVRALLSGSRSQARAGRALAQGSVYGNVLIGAMLHGADRVRQGRTPTDLERMMLDVLKTLAPDAEARQWGRVYRESLAQGQATVVPQSITGLSVDQGYAMEDLRRDLPQIASEAAACPNAQIVDPYAAATQQPESAAFLEAMRQTGFAVTAYSKSSPSGAAAAGDTGGGPAQAPAEPAAPAGEAGTVAPAAAPAFRVALELESFYVHREVGDQWASNDEIYWTASASSGPKTGRTFHSMEFQNVDKGKTFNFPTDNKTLFDSTFTGLLGTVITAWEADQSNAEWFDNLQKALSDALSQLDLAMTVEGFVGVLPTWFGAAFEIAKIFVFIFEAFRNYDDLTCTRFIGMDQQDLAVISYHGGTSWHFNGEGHHELKVKYSGGKIPFPVGTVEYAVRAGDTWSAPIALDWQSTQPPALAAYNGRLYALFVRASDNGVMWSRLEGTAWTTPQRIGGDGTLFSPALAPGHGKLYYVHVGGDERVYWRTYTDTAAEWSAVAQIPNISAKRAPSLTSFGHDMWLTHVAYERDLYTNVHNGTSWSAARPNNMKWYLNNPAAVCVHNNQLWRFYREPNDNQVYPSRLTGQDPPQWGRDNLPYLAGDTTHGPALVTHQGAVWEFIRGKDGCLWSQRYEHGSWQHLQQVRGGEIKPMDESVAVSHDDKLYVMYRR